MNLLKSKVFYIIVLTIALLIIAFVLFNTILYNYKGRLNNYLNNYYQTTSEESLNDINKKYSGLFLSSFITTFFPFLERRIFTSLSFSP